jgi:hypothetical protein
MTSHNFVYCLSDKQKSMNEVLEQGDIYFFYRPKKAAEEVKGIEDVRRFFMVTAPEQLSDIQGAKEKWLAFTIG